MILMFNISCICGCIYRTQPCSGAAGGKVCAVKLVSIKSVLIYIPTSHAWAPLQHSVNSFLCRSICEVIKMYASFMLCFVILISNSFIVWVWAHACSHKSMSCVEVKDNLWALILLPPCGTQDRTQVNKLNSKCLYLPNHFDGSILLYFKEQMVFPFQGLHTSSASLLVHCLVFYFLAYWTVWESALWVAAPQIVFTRCLATCCNVSDT